VSKTAHATSALAICRVRVHRLLLLALALAVPFPSSAGEPISPPAAAVLLDRLPPRWRDDHGEMLRLSALHGQRIFVTMAYTSCHRICPMTMTRLEQVQRELDTRGMSAEFIIVSYDPSNDDAAAWRRYRASHGLVRACSVLSFGATASTSCTTFGSWHWAAMASNEASSTRFTAIGRLCYDAPHSRARSLGLMPVRHALPHRPGICRRSPRCSRHRARGKTRSQP